MRWCEESNKFVTYETYATTNELPRTLLDVVDGKRTKAISDFVTTKGYVPSSDLEVERWFMAKTNLTWDEFKTGTNWRDHV